MITGTVPVEVPKKLSDLELDAGGKKIDNLGLGDTFDDVMRRSEKTESYEVYGLLAVGLAADRPAFGIVDQLYFSTDTLVLERDTGAAWVEVVRGETVIRLAQLAERAHNSLSGIGVDDHHARYTDVEVQAQAAALIVIHAAIAAAHHVKTTDAAEITSGVFILARIPNMDWAHILGLFPRTIADLLSNHNLANHGLGVIVPHDALASLTEKAHASLTGVTANQHHTKYTNVEAQTTVKANVEVGDLKAPTKPLAMNNQNISGIADLTASKIYATTEMYIPAEP